MLWIVLCLWMGTYLVTMPNVFRADAVLIPHCDYWWQSGRIIWSWHLQLYSLHHIALPLTVSLPPTHFRYIFASHHNLDSLPCANLLLCMVIVSIKETPLVVVLPASCLVSPDSVVLLLPLLITALKTLAAWKRKKCQKFSIGSWFWS